METHAHRAMDAISRHWPALSGVTIGLVALVKFWWASRQTLRKRIAHIEKLAEHAATQADLYACRDEVDKQDADNLTTVWEELKDMRKEAREVAASNAKQHQDILTTVANHTRRHI